MKSHAAAFEQFHGIEPETYEEKRLWVPGELVLLGVGVDTGYRIVTSGSNKDRDQEYVHDHKDGVKVYRRARNGERHDRRMRPAKTCWLLGAWLGCTYVGANGKQKEVPGKRLRAVAPNQKTLFALGPRGVEYVIMGGNFRITDWMYD